MPVVKRGLVNDRQLVKVQTAPVRYEWSEDGFVCTVNGGGNVVMRGMVRGEFSQFQQVSPDHSALYTFIAPNLESIADGLVLDEWIYRVEGVSA